MVSVARCTLDHRFGRTVFLSNNTRKGATTGEARRAHDMPSMHSNGPTSLPPEYNRELEDEY